ncbi:hypothetical protein G5I_11664 [Acromyrmex echinatior]|uniref:Uncharacterized protein n=1 Tax=Acromyrmex echinatior TaxID=103372 RepID=F4X0A7_ACREC|nr:hypothetical protein G5I_11664 [Acromyrmex echinatior]
MAERKSDLGARNSAATGSDIRLREATWSRLVPLILQKDEEEVEAEAKPRGAAHTAVNTTSLRPQTSVVLHRSSILPVHIIFFDSSDLSIILSMMLPALSIFHPLKNFKQFIYVFFLYRDHIALQLRMFLTNKIT